MNLPEVVRRWPVLRQLREGDLLGLGRAAQSERSRTLKPRSDEADHVVQSICPYCAVGGVVNYILEHERYFEEYVKHYTNAPVIISEEFKDTEDLDGFFSGWDPEKGEYDVMSWQYAGMEVHGAAGQREEGFQPTKGEGSGHGGHGGGLKHGEPPEEDPELQHPRCVFQLLKKHYARYT